MRTISGGRGPQTPEGGLTFLENRYGVVGASVYRWIFGELWSRPGLSRRDRSLVTIAIIVALGELAELTTHAAAGVHHGLSRAEIAEVLVSIYPYLGAPRTAAATRFVQQVWADRDAAASA
jgi:alkylhydroperoxidase/carboxymuconolactone decarboxylase family protein YurZ